MVSFARIQAFKMSDAQIYEVCLSGEMVATYDVFRGIVRVWNMNTREPLLFLEGNGPKTHAVLITRHNITLNDGKLLRKVNPRCLEVWDVTFCRKIQTFLFEESVQFLPVHMTEDKLIIVGYEGMIVMDFSGP